MRLAAYLQTPSHGVLLPDAISRLAKGHVLNDLHVPPMMEMMSLRIVVFLAVECFNSGFEDGADRVDFGVILSGEAESLYLRRHLRRDPDLLLDQFFHVFQTLFQAMRWISWAPRIAADTLRKDPLEVLPSARRAV
jgi:hypothetical protein